MAYDSKEVAKEALAEVNRIWEDYCEEAIKECNCEAGQALSEEHPPYTKAEILDRDNHNHDCPYTLAYEDCELNLYVRPDGDWAIDHAQYFQGGPVSSCVSLGHYDSVEALADEIESQRDWDADESEEED